MTETPRKTVLAFACASLLATALPTFAAPWAEVGDRALRSDIEMLAARGLIEGPTTTWPMPVGFLAPLQDTGRLAKQPEFIQLAAARVLAKLGSGHRDSGLTPAAEIRFASEPNLIRDFGRNAQDQLDSRVGLNYDNDVFAANLRVGAISRLDGTNSRFALDGSYATALVGNLQIYAGWVDKWYGPGQTSSLILSNNARPFPKVGITRNTPKAFETPWLSWLGTYQIDFSVGLLDEDSRTIRNTWQSSLRFTFVPVTGLEIGLTRSVQFCGDGLNCNPLNAAFAINNTEADRNNSNDQVAIEAKYSQDFNKLSFSPYVQFLNDDTGPFTHSYTSYLAGLSWAGPIGDDGSRWRLTTEYTDSRATLDWFSFGKRVPGFSYNNTEYVDGYRYRGRTLGFSLDSDSTLFSLTGLLIDSVGRTWRLAYYNAHISTDELANSPLTPNYINTVSAQPVTVNQIEAGVSIPWRGFTFDLGARYQDKQPFPDVGSQINVEAGVQYRF